MDEAKEEVYFRMPDQLVLVTKEHEVTGPSEFTLTMKGVVFDYAEASGKIFWLLEPNLEDIRFELQPIKNAIVD